ncbi:MAG: acyltransferase [Phycisphaerae bacterium]
MKKIFLAINSIFLFFIIYLPNPLGRKVRYLYYRKKFKRCGKKVYIDEGVIIQNPEYICIGENVWIDKYCVLMAGPVRVEESKYTKRNNLNFTETEGSLVIGDNIHMAPFCVFQAHSGISIGNGCAFSSGVKIYSLSNLPSDPKNPSRIIFFSPMVSDQAILGSPIVLEQNVGVALNSIILPGVTIEKNSFVAPNSLVMTSFKENSYIEGNPARRSKDRFRTKGVV